MKCDGSTDLTKLKTGPHVSVSAPAGHRRRRLQPTGLHLSFNLTGYLTLRGDMKKNWNTSTQGQINEDVKDFF